jgi:hypothetical protein
MVDIERVNEMVGQVEQAEQADRYSRLVEIHDALRVALAETDGDASAPGR